MLATLAHEAASVGSDGLCATPADPCGGGEGGTSADGGEDGNEVPPSGSPPTVARTQINNKIADMMRLLYYRMTGKVLDISFFMHPDWFYRWLECIDKKFLLAYHINQPDRFFATGHMWLELLYFDEDGELYSLGPNVGHYPFSGGLDLDDNMDDSVDVSA